MRSGQSIVFIEGDVTVLGSVGSGAEIVAGGSIHVYGTLRGRAMAGATGNARARIFCHRIEAELLAIDGYYKTADEHRSGLRRGRSRSGSRATMLKIDAELEHERRAKMAKVLVVTSGKGGVGKTTSTAALGRRAGAMTGEGRGRRFRCRPAQSRPGAWAPSAASCSI